MDMNKVEFTGVLIKRPYFVKVLGNKVPFYRGLLSFPDEDDPHASLPIRVLATNKECAGLFRQLLAGMELTLNGCLKYQRVYVKRLNNFVGEVYVEVHEITSLMDTV